MFQPRQDAGFSLAPADTSCCFWLLQLLARICCCMRLEDDVATTPTGQQQLLETRAPQPQQVESSPPEAAAGAPPRAPATERTRLLKGQPASDAAQPGARAGRRDEAPAKAAAEWPPMKKGKSGESGSQLSLVDDDDLCPTCLEAYSEDNPRVTAKCGHHYHLPCIYEWLERQPTCPMCGRDMVCEELL